MAVESNKKLSAYKDKEYREGTEQTITGAAVSAAVLAASTQSFLMWSLSAFVPRGFDPVAAVFFIASSSATAAVAVMPHSFI